MSNNDNVIKKKLMFVKGEDYYFMTYNIFLLLNALNCKNENKVFKDFRKLAFLIDFVADRNLIFLIEKYKDRVCVNLQEKERVYRSYSEGVVRVKQILKLIMALEKRNMIHLVKDDNKTKNIVNIWIEENVQVKELLGNELFILENENIKMLNKIIPGIGRLSIETLLAKLYKNFGITSWEISL